MKTNDMRNGVSGSRLTTDEVIADFFPETADELRVLNDRLTTEAAFVEVATRSPRYSQQKSTTPVFVIAGFKPKLVDAFYGQFIYPVFEARLPDDVGSVDALSEVLVNVRVANTAGACTLKVHSHTSPIRVHELIIVIIIIVIMGYTTTQQTRN